MGQPHGPSNLVNCVWPGIPGTHSERSVALKASPRRTGNCVESRKPLEGDHPGMSKNYFETVFIFNLEFSLFRGNDSFWNFGVCWLESGLPGCENCGLKDQEGSHLHALRASPDSPPHPVPNQQVLPSHRGLSSSSQTVEVRNSNLGRSRRD